MNLEIRGLMKAKKLTNRAIAEQLGVQPVTVSVVINGHQPSKRIQEAVAKALDKSIDELWPPDPPSK